MYNVFHPLHPLTLIHICHFHFQFYTASGRYIGEISKTAPISYQKNILFNWQFMGHNGNFHFCPVIIQIYPYNISSINNWLLKSIAFWEILPLALLHALNYGLCMAKQEISNISLSVLAPAQVTEHRHVELKDQSISEDTRRKF